MWGKKLGHRVKRKKTLLMLYRPVFLILNQNFYLDDSYVEFEYCAPLVQTGSSAIFTKIDICPYFDKLILYISAFLKQV